MFKRFKLISGDMKEFGQTIGEYPREGFASGYLSLYRKNSDKRAVFS